MRNRLCATLAIAFAACGGDPKIVSVVANPSMLTAGSTTTLTVAVENVEIGEEGHALTARGLRASDGAATGMHLHTYLDNLESNPLAQVDVTTYPVVIPPATPAGAHTLIVRLHGADHTIFLPEVKSSVGITVQ